MRKFKELQMTIGDHEVEVEGKVLVISHVPTGYGLCEIEGDVACFENIKDINHLNMILEFIDILEERMV
jgi:hypothetical protein